MLLRLSFVIILADTFDGEMSEEDNSKENMETEKEKKVQWLFFLVTDLCHSKFRSNTRVFKHGGGEAIYFSVIDRKF